MIIRRQWVPAIEAAWTERPVVWLWGVRRVRKTCLGRSLPAVTYFDCELPRVRRTTTDPQGFWEGLPAGRVVLDEIHRLPNPYELLKIAADHCPRLRVLATGSCGVGPAVLLGSHPARAGLPGYVMWAVAKFATGRPPRWIMS